MKDFKELVDYCLDCLAKPCKKGCPLGNNIPDFIKAAKNQKFLDAFNILSETTVLPSICGRVCPKSLQCEGNCVRRLKGDSVQIGTIEAYIGDEFIKSNYPIFSNIEKANGKKVAIVGGGPIWSYLCDFFEKIWL